MKLALDTNRYTDLCRGDAEVLDVLERAETVLVPFVVIAELRAGFHVGERQRQNEATLDLFLRRSGVTALFADDQTTLHYAALYKQLRAQGTPIPINDLWIASLAVQHNLVLYTRDDHFRHLPQLRLL